MQSMVSFALVGILHVPIPGDTRHGGVNDVGSLHIPSLMNRGVCSNRSKL